MSAVHRIAFFQNRRDEILNQELAKELAAHKDKAGIREIAEHLWDKDKNIQADCIKVLYETGYLEPALIADYAEDFVKLLKSKNNRLVWGGMIALGTIGDLKADVIFAHLAEIQKVFGQGVISSDGQLCRYELAKIVFADPADRKKLEAILHPRIREQWLAQVETWRAAPKRLVSPKSDEGGGDGGRKQDCPLAVVVIPLLFETRAESHFDNIICVACPPAAQDERLQTRGWTPEQIKQRIAAQMPVEQKIARADFVVWTGGALEIHARQIERILARFN